jgi:lysophospholipase L1-like esterase
MKSLILLSALGGLVHVQARSNRLNVSSGAGRDRLTPDSVELVRRADHDPTDFSWVNHLVAIGDSFTAGIGSGDQLGDFIHKHNDWACSRYDGSYPMMVYDKIGSGVDKFQYHACSGDRSEHIFKQAEDLDSDVDLLIMTAGGNDLCLAQMIKICIMIPLYSEENCNDVIAKAEENIDTILKDNLVQVLEAIDGKMADDGIVIYNGYAEYFEEDTDNCEEDQIWHVPKVGDGVIGLKLTKDRRRKFNSLVRGINRVIQEAIDEVKDGVDYHIGFANWDPWPRGE